MLLQHKHVCLSVSGIGEAYVNTSPAILVILLTKSHRLLANYALDPWSKPVLISLTKTKTKTKMFVNENTCKSLTKTKIETKILEKTNKKH